MFKAEKEESTGLIIKEAGGEGSSERFRRKSLLLGVLTPTAGGSFLPAAGGAVLGCHAAMSELGARSSGAQLPASPTAPAGMLGSFNEQLQKNVTCMRSSLTRCKATLQL